MTDSSVQGGDAADAGLTSRQRRELFLDLAGQSGGTTVADVYQRAQALGDTATEEAYHNIARRLVHSSQLSAQLSENGERTRYIRAGERWLEEDELADMVDPDYPIIALTVWREAVQHVNDVPESVWIELRERLSGEDAAHLFVDAIQSYCDDLDAQLQLVSLADENNATELSRLRREADSGLLLLIRLTKFGLGLSRESVRLPASVDVALSEIRRGEQPLRVNNALLKEEIVRRVETGSFVRATPDLSELRDGSARTMLVGGVDGSTRGGLLSLASQDGDFQVAHAPLVSINTAVGQVNRKLKLGGRSQAAFTRLPERPEDMQRQDNRHTVMAKLLHPDLTDAQYMHAVWNAMDLVETRATLRLLRRWYVGGQAVEVPPTDVILRDGAASPQARDFTHYKEQDSYGQIVRDLIETNWEVTLTCREDSRVVCGVVKQTQLSVFGPILNWYACRIAAGGNSQLTAWPLQSMNLAPDQLLITRLLTAGRQRGDPWTRTCVVLRPFHALTNFGKDYRRSRPPADRVLEEYEHAMRDLDALNQDDRVFWSNFQGDRDAFVRMLREAQYGSFFLAPVPRLDNDNMLPRLELLIPTQTAEDAPDPWSIAARSTAMTLRAIAAVGFDVAAEHNVFATERKLDILPRILITTHEIVKTWALELVGRVQEYVGYHLARYVKGKRLRGVQVRPFTRAELEALYAELRRERERQAGARGLQP